MELSAIGFLTAFAAGVLSFLSPCVLPLVPGYLSYVSGSSLEDLRSLPKARYRAVGYALWFVAGFSAVFMSLGASATALGGLLLEHRLWLGYAAGLLVIVFGLHMMGFSPLTLLQRDIRWHADLRPARGPGALLMGVAFAFGWTPCIGPVLGAILTLGASSNDVGAGVALLASYAIGLGVPFVLAALFADVLVDRLRGLTRAGFLLQRAAGALLVLVGILMVTGQLEVIAYWLLENVPLLATIG